ncbi:MAG: hypothetical protein FD163_2563 [Hyphomonadaceae bacterium]|nr:MAG: hypothetical protein FD128_2269 [Hyphomonadaceae bacterium]KAF0182420.1 MAG: hypothetical protein FD163_2563 [Hyphomonadaceae bacterium]
MNEQVETAAVPVEPQTLAQHHIVALPKFFILFIGTFGWYLIYWMFKHWARLRAYKRTKIPSFMILFLLIAFIFPLFGKIKQTLRANKPEAKFANVLCAGAVILLQIASVIVSLIQTDGSAMVYVAMAILIGTMLSLEAWFLSRAQNAANIACGDPKGLANNKFTWLDAVGLVIGGSMWAIVIYGAIISL